ncbi:OsmC family peroxiredoxin [Rhodobacteraceae bacterium RKSG542]|uniref:OsmC family protein n=1 Tax=Pseudovibrio flavus TaxID=2529854 RepID=UPI0012BBDF7C|nr:OsmC family protein [Pseudovibrio flavus]MTI18060.1 OsmC family peroxiredoxin [Pseudovibrio flavus]
MSIKLKPKFFGPVTMESAGEGVFSYKTETGLTGKTGAPATNEVAAPYDLIMAALASCVGVSLEMIARQKKIDLGDISIEVNAAKALDLPSRFGSFDVSVSMSAIEDKEQATQLLKQAKEMCTVSNTLNADVTLSLKETASA